MRLRASFVLLVTALTLPLVSAVDQQHDGFCPPGIDQVYLENSVEITRESVDKNSGNSQHRPAFFAFPLQFDGPLSASLNGTWTENKTTWQICMVASATSASSSSLILILESLRLPLGSRLEIVSNGGSKETLTSFNDGGSLFTRKKATKSMAGNALLLTYSGRKKLGYTAKHEPLQQALPKWQPNIEIKGILKSKFSATSSKSILNSASTRSLLATSKPNKEEGAQTQKAASDAEGLTNTKYFLEGTVQLSTEQIGASVPCFTNAACVPFLEKAKRSTVLLMLVSEFGGRFCTGSLINGPKSDEQLILTANHCRETDDDLTIASTWGVVLENEENTCSAETTTETSAAAAAAVRRMLLSDGSAVVSTKHVIQGLIVAFSDEQSDTMVLKLKNPIPQEYRPYLLGWDASGSSLAPSGSGTVHHPLGDLKKAATSTQPLEKYKWKFSGKTHLRVEWGAEGGGTLDGSSGSALVNKETNQVLGVLSGGITAKSCSGNYDYFGSLEHAWDRGLKEVLSKPAAASQEQRQRGFGFGRGRASAVAGRSMPGREYFENSSNQKLAPRLIITPPRLILSESSKPENVAQISLSQGPKTGESVHVQVTLSQFPTIMPDSSLPTQPPISLLTETLIFTASNWDTAQPVVLVPGEDTRAEGPLPFQLEFKSTLHSLNNENNNAEKSGEEGEDAAPEDAAPPVPLQQRVVQGLRLDEELVPGYSISDPVVLSRDAALGIFIEGEGILEPQGGRNQAIGKIIKLKDPLQEQVGSLPLGSATYFNLTLSKESVFDVKACSQEMELQVAVFFNNTATWVSSESCESRTSRRCKSTQAKNKGCSGFEQLALPSIRFPYTIMVTSTGNGSPAGFFTFEMKQSTQPST